MWGRVVFLCVCFCVVNGLPNGIRSSDLPLNGTEVSQCISSEGDLPIFTEVVGCITPPCLLPQFQDVVLNIVFRAPRTMRSMRTLVTAFLPLPLPYPLGDNAVTCNFLVNTYCPVLESEVIQYQLRMYIQAFMLPGTSVTLEFRIVDQADNSPVACIRVPIRIIPAVESRKAIEGPAN